MKAAASLWTLRIAIIERVSTLGYDIDKRIAYGGAGEGVAVRSLTGDGFWMKLNEPVPSVAVVVVAARIGAAYATGAA